MTEQPSKQEVALSMLEQSTIRVLLDPRVPGVMVPPNFRKDPQLALDVGLNTRIPIPDLHLDNEGMSCTLSFGGTPFFCVLPWRSVFAIIGENDRAVVWPEDVPSEIQLGPPPPPRKVERAPVHLARKPEVVPSLPRRLSAVRADGDGGRPQGGRRDDVPPPTVLSERAGAERRPEKAPTKGDRGDKKRRESKDAPKKRAPLTPVPDEKPAARRPQANRPKRELPPYLRVIK